MASRQLWRVTLVLERDADWQSEPTEWNWSALTDTHVEDVCGHFVRCLSDSQSDDDDARRAAFGDEPRAEPLSRAEIQRRAEADPERMIHSLIAVDLGDVIDHDVDWFLDRLSELAFGCVVDFDYELVDFANNTLRFAVHADPDALLDEQPTAAATSYA